MISLEISEIVQRGGEWQCTWSIDWAGYVKTQKSPGSDKLAALIIALKKAEIELLHYNSRHDEKITWLGEPDLALIWREAARPSE